MVSAEQLPEFVKMFSHNIPIQYGRLETQLATLKNRNSFLRDVLTETTGTALCFLFMESFTTTIILSGNCFYLFESHSRNERGLSIADGTSALVKFNDLFKTEKYIQNAYLEYRDRHQAYFQRQVIEVTVRPIEKTDIYLQYARNVRLEHEHSADINKRQQVYYSNLKGSPQHHETNEKKRQRGKLATDHIKGSSKYKFMVEIRKGKKSFNRCVHRFKVLIKNGPFFLCDVCNRCHYQKSLICFKM